MTFTEKDKLKALAIVSVFETSRPFGDYAACVVLNDGAGVSYGISQFTHRSGSLAAVVKAYLNNGGPVEKDMLAARLPILKTTSDAAVNTLAADAQFKKALRSAAATREMKAAQRQIAFEKYLGPALDICRSRGLVLPLSLAVVYDSVTHGSWERISARVTGAPSKEKPAHEKAWITEYVRKRHLWLTGIARLRATNYRTRFFHDQIAIGNWALRLPIALHGVRLTDAMFQVAAAAEASPAADAGPVSGEEKSEEAPAVASGVWDAAGELLSTAAGKFDRVENVVTAVTARKDAAKSLWTTVIGTVWQAAWAVFGFVIGLPTEVWIVVAVIAAALMLLFLYRQITLGRIRERAVFTPQGALND